MVAPRVTVLTTLYNKGPFVEEAIESILDNTFADFELLVVDDASTDDGLERVRRFSDPRIRILVSDVNTGRAAAANRGYDAARGDYVAVLDADDVADPQRLAKQVAFMDAHPEIDICGSYARVFGARDRVVEWPTTDDEARGVMLFQDPLLYGSAMIRRPLLEANHLRCKAEWRAPGMDYLFLLSIAQHARMATIPEPLTSYRLGEQNFRHGHDHFSVRHAIFREVFHFYDIPATDEEVASHLLLEQCFRDLPDTTRLRALHAWVQKLKTFNQERELFPTQRFETRLQQDWQRWFYLLAGKRPATALLHLRLSGGWPGGRLLYLLKVRLRQLLGG